MPKADRFRPSKSPRVNKIAHDANLERIVRPVYKTGDSARGTSVPPDPLFTSPGEDSGFGHHVQKTTANFVIKFLLTRRYTPFFQLPCPDGMGNAVAGGRRATAPECT
jgi:hypothetical protein